MKKSFLILSILMSLSVFNIHAQCGGATTSRYTPISVGIVIYSNDVETIWNALRLANYSKSQGDTVSIFLLGKGVELDSLVKTEKIIKDQTDDFLVTGGTILGCSTCLQSRKINEPKVCKLSTMKDLYILVHMNKIVMTF